MKISEEQKKFIKNDILYKHMLKYSQKLSYFRRAGFIDENRNIDDQQAIDDLTLKTLSLNPLKTNKPTAIVILTGSFSPLHEGHTGMVLHAKRKLEELGYEVPQGILFFAHDNYVSFKNHGECKKLVSERIYDGFNKIHELGIEDEIKIDQFSGQFVSSDLNFSTLIDRTQKYIEKEYKKEVKIFYLFGSDYPDFWNAFKYQDKIGAFCFERTNSPVKNIPDHIDDKLFFHVPAKDFYCSNLSSTKIRNSLINNNNDIIKKNKKLVYLIREDGAPAEFTKDFENIVKKYISHNDYIIKTFNTTEECLCYGNTISLDKIVKGAFNLDFSRKFFISDIQKYSKEMISLTDPELNNIKQIPEGDYLLFDDDISTGFTFKTVKNILSTNKINIIKTLALANNYTDKNEEIFDIIDARDFIPNTKNGGLVVSFMDQPPLRVPYFYPFVNLTSRANIPAHSQIQFTIDVLELNKKHNLLTEEYAPLLTYLTNYISTLRS